MKANSGLVCIYQNYGKILFLKIFQKIEIVLTLNKNLVLIDFLTRTDKNDIRIVIIR